MALLAHLFGRKTVEDDPYQMPDGDWPHVPGRLPASGDRAGRASPEPFGLGHSATITDAINNEGE